MASARRGTVLVAQTRLCSGAPPRPRVWPRPPASLAAESPSTRTRPGDAMEHGSDLDPDIFRQMPIWPWNHPELRLPCFDRNMTVDRSKVFGRRNSPLLAAKQPLICSRQTVSVTLGRWTAGTARPIVPTADIGVRRLSVLATATTTAGDACIGASWLLIVLLACRSSLGLGQDHSGAAGGSGEIADARRKAEWCDRWRLASTAGRTQSTPMGPPAPPNVCHDPRRSPVATST